jgi:excisionase family DNA binding protein
VPLSASHQDPAGSASDLGSSAGSLLQPSNPLRAATDAAPGLPSLVDIPTVSRSFGISTRQVRRFVADGQIPFVRVGHLIRFDLDALKEWIDARRAGSVNQGAIPTTSSGQGRPEVGAADP